MVRFTSLVILEIAIMATVLFSSEEVIAQSTYPKSQFGIRVGGNANSWTNEFPALEFEDDLIYPDSWKVHFGGHLGAYINIRLSQLVALEPGVFYSQKGTSTTLDLSGIDFEGTIKSNYLDLPLLLRLYPAGGFNIFMGVQFAYHLNSSFDFEVDGNPVIDGEDTTDTISEFDVAPVLGIGYEFEGGFNLNLAGELGMISVDGIGNLDTFNRNIRLSIGYAF